MSVLAASKRLVQVSYQRLAWRCISGTLSCMREGLVPAVNHTRFCLTQILVAHVTCLQQQGFLIAGKHVADPRHLSIFYHKLNAHTTCDTPTSPTVKQSETMTWHACGLRIPQTPTSLNVASMMFTFCSL